MQEAFMKLTGNVNPMHMEDAYAREKCLFQECDVS